MRSETKFQEATKIRAHAVVLKLILSALFICKSTTTDDGYALSASPGETKRIFGRTVDGICYGTVLVLENNREYEVTTSDRGCSCGITSQA